MKKKYKLISADTIKNLIEFLDEIQFDAAKHKDDKESIDILKKMSYDGRVPDVPWRKQNIDMIGYHYYMTPETAQEGIDKGIPLDNLTDYAKSQEQRFIDQIFQLDKDNQYVVTDGAALMAGREATMTKDVEQALKNLIDYIEE